MSRSGYIKDGMFVEAYIVPNADIMRDAYGKVPGHTCAECCHWVLMVRNHTCDKLDPKAIVPCFAGDVACGRFEAKL